MKNISVGDTYLNDSELYSVFSLLSENTTNVGSLVSNYGTANYALISDVNENKTTKALIDVLEPSTQQLENQTKLYPFRGLSTSLIPLTDKFTYDKILNRFQDMRTYINTTLDTSKYISLDTRDLTAETLYYKTMYTNNDRSLVDTKDNETKYVDISMELSLAQTADRFILKNPNLAMNTPEIFHKTPISLPDSNFRNIMSNIPNLKKSLDSGKLVNIISNAVSDKPKLNTISNYLLNYTLNELSIVDKNIQSQTNEVDNAISDMLFIASDTLSTNKTVFDLPEVDYSISASHPLFFSVSSMLIGGGVEEIALPTLSLTELITIQTLTNNSTD